MKNNKSKAIIKLIILGLIIIIVPTILYLECKDTLFNTEWLKNLPTLLAQNKPEAALILIGLQALQVIICLIPGQPIQFASSYMFGVIGGYLISIIGAVIGATIAFYLAKILGADAVKMLFNGDKVEKYRSKINSGQGLLIVFLIYLLPGFPKDLVGYVAGISDMRILPFLIISSAGRTPGMLGSLFLGNFFNNKNIWGIIILVVLCVVVLTMCFIFRNKLIHLLDELEEKDIERKAKHDGKKANK